MSSQIFVQEYESPVGVLLVGSYENQLCLCDWKYRKQREEIDNRIRKGLNASYIYDICQYNINIISILDLYFKSELKNFDLNIKIIGTEFQKMVWNELVTIPYGTTLTYLQLSKKLGNEKAIRAVAAANGANAISIIVPCHRIIASDGSMQGYAGGISTKKKLLELEGWNDAQLKLEI